MKGIVRLAKRLWPLPALAVLALLVGTTVFTWGVPYVGAVWDSTGRVIGVEPGGATDRAGLRPGDVMLSVNGHPPVKWADRVRHAFRSDDAVSIIVQREDGTHTILLTADLFPVNYRLASPLALLVALSFCLLSLVVLSGTDTLEAQLFYLMAQTWAAALAAGILMTAGVPGMWEALGVLSGLLAAVMIHFYAVFPERRWLAERRWLMGVLYGTGLIVALRWIPSPFSYPSIGAAWSVTVLWLGLGFAAAIGLMVAAYVTTRSPYARRRIRLVVLGTVLGFGPFGLFTILLEWMSGMFTIPLMIAVPAAYAVALWRYNLMGFDRVLNRGLVYLTVSILLFGVYFTALTLFHALLPVETTGQAALGAAVALLAAVTFRPLRDQVQRLVDRLFYGGWYDYRGLIEEVGGALARTLDQETLTDVLVRQVPEAMHLPAAALWLERGGRMEVVGASGMETTEALAAAQEDEAVGQETKPAQRGSVTRPPVTDGSTELEVRLRASLHFPITGEDVRMVQDRVEVPLVVEGRMLGAWVLGGRPGEEWGPEDKRILAALGQQAALAAQNVRLIAELRAKVAEVEKVHRRLLVAREEERADLARELHDGVIQELIGLRYRLEALQEEAGGFEQMGEMHAQVGQLMGELRRLCSDLRPPALDQLGLAAALRALAREVTTRGLPVETHLEDMSLPDGIAIGLYRICQEALFNALRHAGASCAVVTLSRDGNEVVLTVADDGRGFDPAATRGQAGRFGLLGMAERAEALGGHLAMESAPGEGTRVAVRCGIL